MLESFTTITLALAKGVSAAETDSTDGSDRHARLFLPWASFMVRAIKIEEMVCFGDGYGILQYISAAHEAPFATGNDSLRHRHFTGFASLWHWLFHHLCTFYATH